MSLGELLTSRHSVRAYRSDPIDEATLMRVLEAARLAPTACNRQPFRLLVVRTAGREEQLRRVYHRPWFSQAPMVIGIVGIPSEAWVRSDGQTYLWVDAAIAMDHIVLAATEAGLGTCWVANFDAAAAHEVFQIPDTAVPIAFTPIGVSEDTPKGKSRRPLEELVRYDHW